LPYECTQKAEAEACVSWIFSKIKLFSLYKFLFAEKWFAEEK